MTRGNDNAPYISAVTWSRNDDHISNKSIRLQTSILGMINLAIRHRVRLELILVDYNPPQDRAPLASLFNWPVDLANCTIREIVVPPSAHLLFSYSDLVPVHPAVALNAGIRRAKGQFVLATSPHTIISDDLMEFFATETLDPQKFYRIDRSDVSEGVLDVDGFDAQQAYCQENIVGVQEYQGQGLNWRNSDVPRLHTNAAGDFVLLAKDIWHQIRGYEESSITSLWIDGVICYAAYMLGVTQEVILPPKRLFSIAHPSTWMSPRNNRFQNMGQKTRLLSEIGSKLDSFLMRMNPSKSNFDRLGIPQRSRSEYISVIDSLISGDSLPILNGPSWGLQECELEETS
jgi:hypothetical protein